MYEKFNNNKNIEIMKEGEEKITPLKKEEEKQTEKIDNENKDNIIKKLNKENKELNKIEDNEFLINQLRQSRKSKRKL